MERRVPWLWIGVAAALLLLPTSAGRLLLDVIGGLTLTLLLLPLLAGAAVLIGWQVLRRRLRTCPSCGFASLGSETCPACGCAFEASPGGGASADGANPFFGRSPAGQDIDARDVTITVDAVAIDGPGAPGVAAQGSDANERPSQSP